MRTGGEQLAAVRRARLLTELAAAVCARPGFDAPLLDRSIAFSQLMGVTTDAVRTVVAAYRRSGGPTAGEPELVGVVASLVGRAWEVGHEDRVPEATKWISQLLSSDLDGDALRLIEAPVSQEEPGYVQRGRHAQVMIGWEMLERVGSDAFVLDDGQQFFWGLDSAVDVVAPYQREISEVAKRLSSSYGDDVLRVQVYVDAAQRMAKLVGQSYASKAREVMAWVQAVPEGSLRQERLAQCRTNYLSQVVPGIVAHAESSLSLLSDYASHLQREQAQASAPYDRDRPERPGSRA